MRGATSGSTGWSPDPGLWAALSRKTGGIAWKRVDFSPSLTHRVPKQDAGVYLICARPPARALETIKTYTVLYAGQVKSRARGLRTRFLEHIQRPSPKLRLFLRCFNPELDFWYAVSSDELEIDTLETLLIDTFNPPCNNISAPRASAIRARVGVPRPIGSHSPRGSD